MLVALAWLSLGWAQGIEGGAAPPGEPAPPIVEVVPTSTAVWDAWRPGDIVVSEPGDPASASLLRYAFTVGERQTFALAGSMTMTMAMMDLTPTVVEVPSFRADGWIEVDAVNDGVASTTVRFTRFTVDGDVDPAMRDAFKDVGRQVRKYRGEADIDARGRTVARRDNSAEVFDANTRQLMDLGAMLFQLPETPVGDGAVWHTGALKASAAAANLQLETLSTFTLRHREGPILDVGLTTEIRLADGSASAVPIPGLDGVNLTFERVGGRGEGAVRIHLGSPLPVRSEAKEHSEVVLSGAGGPIPLDMTQTLDMTLMLTSDAE